MGSGFRTFTAGEVLTASNVQNYLMDQSVMSFAGSAARSSAIGTANFEEGMVSYLQDTNLLEVYNGTNWASVAPSGPTPGLVQIGTAISFSGVSSVSLAADTFTSTYDNYRILFITEGASTDNSLTLRLRASGSDNSTSNYNTSAITPSYLNQTNFVISPTATRDKFVIVEFYNPKLAQRTYMSAASGFFESGGAYAAHSTWAGYFRGADVFDSASFLVSSGTITNGKVYVYGYNQ